MQTALMNSSSPALPPDLVARVLDRLQVEAPAPSLEALGALYAAWCRQVPFDNVRKLIHLKEQSAAPLPGAEPEEYLETWLRHGAGGTCWAGSEALLAVLRALGFEAERCVATMLAAPNLPPNHGSVRVRIEGRHHLVDTSILFGEPLPLSDGSETHIAHPAWGVRGTLRDGSWHIRWRPLHQPGGFDCRFDRFGAEHEEYRQRYEDTRGWSPFNFQVTARRNRGDEVIGMSFGNAITLRADGSVHVQPITDAERRRRLIEDFGMSEELIAQLPEDRPTPPPPGSKTAARAAAAVMVGS